ncbi:MAG: hypothetical protein AB7V13_20045 [Pseudorhodoplanes sp.]|uniref:hypothetical protein n=1 Tax=Pseudorhodoplanes sp. TaxID=1934341 RepID=UPI003D09D2B9
MAKEPIQQPKPPAEVPEKPYPVENPPEPHPNEARPLVDPVPPDKELPRMQQADGRGSMKSEQPPQPDGAPDQQPGAVRGT